MPEMKYNEVYRTFDRDYRWDSLNVNEKLDVLREMILMIMGELDL